MSLSTLLLTNLAVVMASMALLWLASLALRNVSIVDIFWGPGFAVIALLTFALLDGDGAHRWLLAALTAAWGVRLGLYLAVRNVGHGEDPRYARIRERVDARGLHFPVSSLLIVFAFQGVLMWSVSLPVQVGQYMAPGTGAGALAVLGVVLWITGFGFEAIGDWQLRRFKADPANRGKVLDSGLWRYTRHPNYFGNACLWWGLWLIAADAGAWWTVFAPALMTFLLLRVSGVTLLEKSLSSSKPDYADYVRRTSAFIPMPPRSGSDG